MKITRQGKKYEYDYMTLLIKGQYHRQLKKLSETENLPMGKMISKLVEHYESSNQR